MRKHTLEATGGKTYAQMDRFLDASGKPTSDEKAAATDPKSGKPVENPAAQHLGQRDRAEHRAEHGVLRRERRDVRDRHRHRAAAAGIGFLVLTVRLLTTRTEPRATSAAPVRSTPVTA